MWIKAHAAHTFKQYPGARQFTDYRQMLDEVKEIDGVVIATPDHHHAFASMEAIRRGKHVYCEKPLTHSVWEARHLAGAARPARVATQMGNGGQASRETRRLCEYVWADAIGDVREVHIWTDRPSNGLIRRVLAAGCGRPLGHSRQSLPRSIGICGWVRHLCVLFIRPICRSNGAVGGISALALWGTSAAIRWILCFARSSLAPRSTSKLPPRASMRRVSRSARSLLTNSRRAPPRFKRSTATIRGLSGPAAVGGPCRPAN